MDHICYEKGNVWIPSWSQPLLFFDIEYYSISVLPLASCFRNVQRYKSFAMKNIAVSTALSNVKPSCVDFLVFIKNLNNLCKHQRRNIHTMIWYAEKSHLFISDKKSSSRVEMLVIGHKFTLLRKTGLYSNLYICNNALNKFSFWYFRYKRRQLEGHFRIVLQLKPLQATTKGSIATTAAQCQSKHSNSIGW